MNENQQICFTDSTGKELFSLPDNGVLCRFLDQSHAEIDGVKYAVQEFARRMEHNKISFAPA